MLFCQKKKDKKNLKIWLKILFSKISEIISLNYSQKKRSAAVRKYERKKHHTSIYSQIKASLLQT